jgi:HPt (histidine-containing phosphotransfer) domain-containing protein
MITDLSYLVDMSSGDSNFIAEMVGLFREQVNEYGELMPRLLEDKAFKDLGKLAHKAKSSVAVMGMSQTADLLKELEILATEGKHPEKYEEMIDTFREHCRLALIELDNSK